MMAHQNIDLLILRTHKCVCYITKRMGLFRCDEDYRPLNKEITPDYPGSPNLIRTIRTDSGILTMSSPRANPCRYDTFSTAPWSSPRPTSAVGHQATGRAHFCLPAKEGSWEANEGEDANSQTQRHSVRMLAFLR